MPSPPKSKLAAAEAQKSQQTEEILDSVLPPREWSEEGQLWVQRVSSTPATRLDVINLQVSSAAALSVRGYHRSALLCSALVFRSSWTFDCSSGRPERLGSAQCAESSIPSALVSPQPLAGGALVSCDLPLR